MDKYFIGGIDADDENLRSLFIGGVERIVGNDFRTHVRDSLIDWGTFLEIYKGVINKELLYNQASQLLYLGRLENYQTKLLPLLRHIYKMPEKAHLAAMTKQFMLEDNLATVVQELFALIKKLFENSITTFIHARNRFIQLNNIDAEKNNIDELYSGWEQANLDYRINSSSHILFFISNPQLIKVDHQEIDLSQDDSIPVFHISAGDEGKELEEKIRKFEYKGFCPKKARKRLLALLEFPIEEVISLTKKFDPEAEVYDFEKYEKEIGQVLRNKGKIWPEIEEKFEREKEPENLEELQAIKWNIQKIMELRKKLIPYGQMIENHHLELADNLSKVVQILK
jgi:hypothetical protein